MLVRSVSVPENTKSFKIDSSEVCAQPQSHPPPSVRPLKSVSMATRCNVLTMFPPLGDVLQLPLPLRGALLLPGTRPDAEGSRGWDRSHVYPKGQRKTTQ